MHVRCLRRGTGSAGKAAGYLVGERDAMGRERDGVEVLGETRTWWPPSPTRWSSSTSTARS